MRVFLATALEKQTEDERVVAFRLRELLAARYGEGAVFLAAYEFPTPDKYLPPRESLYFVLRLLMSADAFVLYYPHKVASGAILELGYALAWGKSCLALTGSIEALPYMVREGADGLDVAVVPPESSADEYFQRVCTFVDGLKATTDSAAKPLDSGAPLMGVAERMEFLRILRGS